jgi:hypothetical protein
MGIDPQSIAKNSKPEVAGLGTLGKWLASALFETDTSGEALNSRVEFGDLCPAHVRQGQYDGNHGGAKQGDAIPKENMNEVLEMRKRGNQEMSSLE